MTNVFIVKGIRFKSVHFSADAEVKEVRESQNEVDVILTPSDGHAYVEKNWNLAHLKLGFNRGEYSVSDQNEPRIIVY